MQKNKLVILLISVVSLLSSCATVHHEAVKHDQDYLQQANTVPATTVITGHAAPMQSYYPIPPVNANYATQPPTLIPPGSNIAVSTPPRRTVVATAPAPRATTVIASSSNALVLNAPYTQAWSQVGQGLKSAGYKVMQQDKSMGAYYILDLAGSGGVLKTDTPIYRVNVRPAGNNTNVSLVDGQNNPANPAVASRILGALKQKL